MNFYLIVDSDGEFVAATDTFESALGVMREKVLAFRVTTEEGVVLAEKPKGDMMRLVAVGRDAGTPWSFGMAS